MPIVTVQLMEGRTPEQKAAMIKEITEAIVKTTGAKRENVSIIVNDMKKENYGLAGKSLAFQD
ncbi:2-hydroxymuconate tautomerase [Vagococcus intermedius]|uniref:Tautomerase n=1 Tax=Vagococcus intermedius TaxID=2991418 RepID=A0AAF0I6Y3_9ENTE|nr:2-hydroxymuconate tautomerase [Vagococcus intermedius]WEG72989.1 2-hydroxymuconate tautomerase family protein [Vagococcus intermedius]WEG75075.1 2-hydroxymuconate tautomerase family protein [Vagococcus intermedius]